MEGTEFSNEQFNRLYPDGIENHYWNHARNAIILKFLKKVGLDNKVILEIGGGRGIVTKYLHDKGISCQGVELAHVKAVKGTEEYFFTGTNAFTMAESLRNKIHVILLFDVIEHIENPVSFFDEVMCSFPGVRHIVVTVPARQELWTNYDDYNGHFRRYALEDLQALSPATYSFRKGGYFNHILYPVFLLYARFIRQRETTLHAPKGFMIAVHRVLSLILQVDYRIMPDSWRGTSCIGWYVVNGPTNL